MRGWRRFWWLHPFTLLGAAAAGALLFVALSKMLIILAYMSGGLFILILILWLLWRWY